MPARPKPARPPVHHVASRHGVNGQFARGQLPTTLSSAAGLDYAANGIALNIERNGGTLTAWRKRLTNVPWPLPSKQLGAGNSVYENVLLARRGCLSPGNVSSNCRGEIYPAVGSAVDQRQPHVARCGGRAFGRQRERCRCEYAAQDNGWIKGLGAWGKTDSRSDTAGYSTSIGGLLAGVDGALGEADPPWSGSRLQRQLA